MKSSFLFLVAGLFCSANAVCISLLEAVEDMELGGFAALLASQKSGLLQALSEAAAQVEESTEKMTFLVPSNNALATYALSGSLDGDDIEEIISNSIIGEVLYAEDIEDKLEGENAFFSAPTLLGPDMEFVSDGRFLYATPENTDIQALITQANVATCVGVLHVVDQVLVPSELSVAAVPQVATAEERF